MEPIIDPKLFYLCDVCDTLDTVLAILLVISVIMLLILTAIYTDTGECFDEDDAKVFKRVLTATIISLSISLLGVIFIPNKKTIYQMMVFDNITENNIQAGKDDIKELIDYTIDKIDEVNKED